MTTSLKFLIILMVLAIGPVYGQSKFLALCENPTPDLKNEMRWLKAFFKEKSCEGVATQISKLKSYNEFGVSFSPDGPLPNSWLKAFPHFYGLRADELQAYPLLKDEKGYVSLRYEDFDDPEIYSEFKNLKVIDLTFGRYHKKTECEIIKSLPHLEIALVDMVALENLIKCSSDPLPDLIVLRDFIAVRKYDVFADKFIGFEDMANLSMDLYRFPRIRYLGISFNMTARDYQALVQNQNITHLSLNSTASLENAVFLGEIPNLSFLSLSCTTRPLDLKSEYCPDAGLRDVNFLLDLPFLEEIILDFKGLKDISALDKMPQLKLKSTPFVP